MVGGAAQLLSLANEFNMPITYTIDPDQKLIIEVWTGEIRAVDLAEFWKRLLSDHEAMAIRRSIADVRQAEILFNGWEMNNLIRSIVRPMLAGRDWKTAIVAEKPVQIAMSRQYQVFADAYSEDAMFPSIEEARSWLCASDSMKV
jgi:hypothetical protein